MHIRTVLVALACAALVVPAVAQAKGVSQATVQGDGLDQGGIVFKSARGGNPAAGSALSRLVRDAGFYPAAFGVEPNRLEPGRPKGDLGRKYTITYTIPGPNNELYEVHQDLYPYAAGGAVTFMASGQPFFRRTTRGGWFRASPGLEEQLVEAGLPATASRDATGSGHDISWPAAGLSVLVVGLLGTAAITAVRRRTRPMAAR